MSHYVLSSFTGSWFDHCFICYTQASFWSVCEGEEGDVMEGTLPTVPNLHYVVGMLVHLEHVHQGTLTLLQLASQLGDEAGKLTSRLEKLFISNSHVALCCNELAASLLTVIKSTPCTTSKELSSEVQSLSHEIARAGKNLNHLLKKQGVSRRASSRAQPQLPRSKSPNSVAVPDTGSRGALTVKSEPELREKKTEEGTESDPVEEEHKIENIVGDIVEQTKPCKTPAEPVDSPQTCESENSIGDDDSCGTSVEQSGLLNSGGSGMTQAESSDLSNNYVRGKLHRTGAPLTGVGVRHSEMSNATGQVIPESPTNSPLHQTCSQNGFAVATVDSVSDDEDSSVI